MPFRKYGTWLMLGSILLLFTACKVRPEKGVASTMELLSVLRQMPDSLRSNPFGDKSGLELSSEQMDQLIATKEVIVSDDCLWMLEFQDSAQNHLKIRRLRSEEGLQYELLRLKGKNNSNWILITQRLDDHCCSYVRWALFEGKNGKLYDETKARLPKLDWSSFYPKDFFANASQPEGFRDNHYPIAIVVKHNPPSIQIDLVAEYIALNFPEPQSKLLLENFPKASKFLIWENEKFVWENE